ncbi:MAG: ATP-binding cassette domain-containing protein [Flavobacteriaceae bacterium]|jgi:cell division transport system ATP-binding protein|nr:ATP-binding cassette domain-containing protein [Flavobacteriaceae bacterium]MBT4297359.1 ATP-binding cassette domain-containing protein [Flavobacteriaceae bacterium]MBT5233556.1 ATP-binding cassette domain-containing protein [Flavobacteriaceae bacterium]MBT5492827.1 ATP-binding cassette domain-containing protein [Flavobacteriaceae bacterium]MBT7574162.1 ATP-binding cassette domain-containing protein [Flavobacteriaceae bacterium]|tara:strand:- start:2960 stop:3637 length:678 start_codon:yes stop_codon:yes gene_type:complete
MNPIVFLKNVSIKQNNTPILTNINLSVEKGEFIYFIGKTGVGKSSLLRILYGDIIIKEGEAKILDTNLIKIKDKEIPLLRRKLGIVFQDFKLLPNITIKKNLEFVLRATEWKDSKKINSRIIEVLDKVKLDHVIEKYPFELSGGEQQRVAISRALLNNPEIILADEPTGNLDPATSSEIMNLIKEINNSGTTILIATHDYDIISKFPEKTIRIEKERFFELSKKS